MTFTLKLLKKEEIATGTSAFHFEKPAGFEFKPGQNADWTLLSPAEIYPTAWGAGDAEGNKRTFSFVSAPFERELIFATRMRDTAFKRVLKNLPIGAEIQMEGPFGSFTLHKDETKPAVFLAGGIGITPFMSIIRYVRAGALSTSSPSFVGNVRAAALSTSPGITLFYSNRRVEDAAFLTELEEYDAEGGAFHLVATMTEPNLSAGGWEEETGYIDAAMLARHLPDLAAPIYYIAGPPAMVAAMRKMLEETSANPDNIRTEDFSGY